MGLRSVLIIEQDVVPLPQLSMSLRTACPAAVYSPGIRTDLPVLSALLQRPSFSNADDGLQFARTAAAASAQNLRQARAISDDLNGSDWGVVRLTGQFRGPLEDPIVRQRGAGAAKVLEGPQALQRLRCSACPLCRSRARSRAHACPRANDHSATHRHESDISCRVS